MAMAAEPAGPDGLRPTSAAAAACVPTVQGPAIQVIAMHGWAGSAAGWEPWRREAEARGWSWRSGERGYGSAPAWLPNWDGAGQRVLISHSMGLHLLPAAVLAAAERVVLLAGFGRFVPKGAEGRGLRTALAGMAAALEEGSDPLETGLRVQALLRSFLARAAEPDDPRLLPAGPAEHPVGAAARARLRDDLALLAAAEALPEGFPAAVPVLLVEAGEDRIVAPAAAALLRRCLPEAERLLLPGTGHAFLSAPPLPAVLQWLERMRSP